MKESIQKEIINEIYQQAKEREIHPSGDFDKKKRWYPDFAIERYTDGVRTPSAAWPFSLMTHCRTKKFIKKMVEESGVKTLEEALILYTKGVLIDEVEK